DRVGLDATRREEGAAREVHVLGRRSSAPADRDHLDLMPEGLELAGQRDEEAAEVGMLAARPHLGHLEDPHVATLRSMAALWLSAASRMPSPRPGVRAWRACSQ